MDCDDFCTAVADHYLSLHGAPLMISPGDYQEIRRWWATGVSAGNVCEELTNVMARQRERMPRWKPRRIAYFWPAIKVWADAQAEWRATENRN